MTKRNDLHIVDALMSKEFQEGTGEFHTNEMIHQHRHEHVAIILHYAKERAKKEGMQVRQNKVFAEEDTVDDELDPKQKHLNELLCDASRKGDIEMIDYRINVGAHVNAKDDDDWTALHWAAEHGKEESIVALFRHGASPNMHTDLDQTPLHFAARHNSVKVVSVLLENGANVDATDENQRTPLQYALDENNEDVALVIKKAESQKRADEALLESAQASDDEGVAESLEGGANVHAVDKNSWTALHWAAKEKRSIMMSTLLDHGANANAIDNEGTTPLHIVTEMNVPELATILLQNGANMEAKDKVLMTPLHRATMHGVDDVVHLLISRKADFNAKDRVGRTPLHLAAKEGHELPSGEGWSSTAGIVTTLLKVGANVDELDRGLRSPLHWAAAGGHVNVVQLLLDAHATVDLQDRKGFYAADLALKNGHESAAVIVEAAMTHKGQNLDLLDAARVGNRVIVAEALENGADINFKDTKSRAALHLASNNGHDGVVQTLLKFPLCEVDVRNEGGYTPLHLACRQGHAVVARMLLDHGAALDACDEKDEWTPLFEALHQASDKHVEVIRILLQGGATVNAVSRNGMQPIHLAAEGGHVGALNFLLDHGQEHCSDDLSRAKTSHNRWEPLSFAAKEGNLGAVYALLEHGAEVGATNVGGTTALHYAAQAGHSRVVRALLKKGAEVNAVGNSTDISTPLHLAIELSHLAVVEELIKRGADVNAVELKMGWSPLHVAALKCHDSVVERRKEEKSSIIRKLVDSGANFEAADFEGKTPLHLSSEEGLWLSTKTLLECGAPHSPEDNRERIPLHLASMNGHKEVCVLLLERGSNKRQMDHSGRNSIVLAEERGHGEVVYELNKSKW